MAAKWDDHREYPLLIGGREVAEGELVPLHATYGGRQIASVWTGTRAHAEAAIAAAACGFEEVRAMPAFARQRVLNTVAATLSAEREEFARTITEESGKPIQAARAEVDRAQFTFQVAAEESTRIAGELLPMDVQELGVGRMGMVKRFPLGVIIAITPFNFPLNLVAHKVAPAIAAGCAMVLKPAPQTPLSAWKLAKAAHAAGWPAAALNVLPLKNEDAAALMEHELPRMISFTGSAKVGWQIKAAAGKKKVVLELGGNAAVIVHSDADIEHAVKRCVAGGFTYSGQSCISVQRIYVERSRYDSFLRRLVAEVERLTVGDPSEESTDVGPMIREADAVRAQQWIEEALAQGAEAPVGGPREGNFLAPTVLVNTRIDQKVNSEELFAPVVTIAPYDDFDEALAQVNATRYGLQAGIFTHDSRLIFKAFERLEVGGVMVNEGPTFRLDHMPYGGVKDSGLGREGVRYAIEEMTEPKLLVMTP